LTSDLDECRAVPHPWKFEVSERRVGVWDQGWDQVQQVSHCAQELDVKQRQWLWEGQQINSWLANKKKKCYFFCTDITTKLINYRSIE